MTTHTKKYLKDYRPFDFQVNHIDLKFDIFQDHTLVTAVTRYTRKEGQSDQPVPLTLHRGDYPIVSVVADGMVLMPHEYDSDKETLTLRNTPDRFSLEIVTRLDPAANTALEGLYKSGEILCTQCEAQGFRKITPFPDRPDVMTTYTCTIIADKQQFPVLLSNGNPVGSGNLPEGRHYANWEDPHKKPAYLFALVAGNLAVLEDAFTTASGRKVDLKIYSEPDNIRRCSHAMTSLKQAMAWDEERFGLAYDLDLYQIVAINDFNAGAMENKGLNIFNAKFVLADPDTATDEDFLGIQGVIAHEYFHNWTGNRVTLKNWFQLSLKEGLTVFRDQEFSSDVNSRPVQRISDVKNLRAFQFPEDAGPMTHPVRPDAYMKMDNFYTMTVYEKGAELVRMIFQLLGKDGFRKGMDLYFERFDGMAVTIEDFLDVMATASGKDLTQFMTWYTQSGTPEVRMTRNYDAASETLTLTFYQTTRPDRNQSEKSPLHIPIRIGFVSPDGEAPEEDTLLELTQETESFKFTGITPGTVPSVFREFSAPIRLTTDYTDQEYVFLMARDTDEFNQWDAAQILFMREIKKLVSQVQAGSPMSVSPELISAFKTALTDPHKDPAFLARALTLPQETEIKDHFDIIDVDAIHRARGVLKQQIAEALVPDFKERYSLCSTADPKDISGQAMAARALKNTCLSFLATTAEGEELVSRQFDTAQNMTDEFAAFRLLNRMSEETQDRACKTFHAKWQVYPLVLDKWFAVQAATPLPHTLERVKALTGHPDFSITNPNKVRALIYSFALLNPTGFHATDGSGYDFIRDCILKLDKINHQIAARLAGSLNLWKRYDDLRKAKMKSVLESIIAEDSLSRNVYEIVSRALE